VAQVPRCQHRNDYHKAGKVSACCHDQWLSCTLAETGNLVLYKHCKYRYIPGGFPAVGKFTCNCVMGGIIQVLTTGRAKDFHFTNTRRSALGLRECWVCFAPGVKRLASVGDHLPLLNAEFTNEWIYTATSPYILSWPGQRQLDPYLFLNVIFYVITFVIRHHGKNCKLAYFCNRLKCTSYMNKSIC